MATVKFHKIVARDGDEVEVDGEPIGVVENQLSNDGVFVVTVVDDETPTADDLRDAGFLTDEEHAERSGDEVGDLWDDDVDNTDSEPFGEPALQPTLADVTGLDADDPVTELKGIGPARAEDAPVDRVGDLPSDFETLVAVCGAAFAQAVDRNYDLP